jgi:hypothetical protein
MTKRNVLDKIKSGFYWYNRSFQVWKELLIVDGNDTEKIKIFSDYIFGKMNIETLVMKASSKEWQEKYAAERELRDDEVKND